MMRGRVVVAGGAGFIGRHLCARLLQHDASVTCVDNFCTSSPTDLAPLLEHPNFTLVPAAIEELSSIETDVVFHLASPASPRHYQRLAMETMMAGSIGTFRLAELAAQNHARFIFASTSEVYGDPLVHPQTESYWGNVNPTGVRACYDEAKRFSEALLMEFHRKRGLDVRIARIFNTYGPGMALDDGRAIPEFIKAALIDMPMLLHNGGQQTRSFCFVSDTVAGLIALAESPDAGGKVVNIGNPVEHSIRDIALAVAEAVGVAGTLENRPGLADDPVRRRPDITTARTMLGWAPKVDLREGLAATVSDFAARLHPPVD